jgi:hypothetical protein
MQTGLMAEQSFERGHMLWRETDKTVFVLRGDGTWHRHPDTWHEGMPEDSCPSSPPDELLQPKRGFGLVWCEEADIREALGWATDEEHGEVDVWQVFEQGQMVYSDTRGITYALFQDGTYLTYHSAP